MQVQDVMTKAVITVKADDRIPQIAKLLTENHIAGAPVVDEEGKLIGVVTEGDLLHKETNPRLPDFVGILGAIIYYRGIKRYNDDFRKLLAVTAREIMTAKVITIGKEATIEEAAEIMLASSVKRLPVMDGDKMLGIISRSDIVKTLIEE